MFDTIIFDQPIPCPRCGAAIGSDQTKAFERTLEEYRIGDCIAHAEEIRIVGDDLYCHACHTYTTRYYLAVYRGILVGIELEREAAEAQLRSFNFEKLLLWYHDLYQQRERARGQTHRAEMFMHNVCQWFEGGYDKMAPEDRRRLLFIWSRDILEESDTPLAALHGFQARRQAEAQASNNADDPMNLW
ncbi:MAG: hypothetical protein HUU23_11505 [Caldilineales bacterium]|nr:hypothetical protein [Caldilineales bacterium]